MEKINFENFNDLSKEELLQIDGGGLTELTEAVVECAGYIVGWLSSRKITSAHESALLGPNARPTG
ncbi:hypothetical protein ACFSKL_08485 [Belliella marina]|uniref:Bacteriocin-type signal sequence n=1 Tax=Belliella marina TaxID=1644146 RepID=A0ABW4VLL7_9BACT